MHNSPMRIACNLTGRVGEYWLSNRICCAKTGVQG